MSFLAGGGFNITAPGVPAYAFPEYSTATKEGGTRDVAAWIAAAGDAVSKSLLAYYSGKAAVRSTAPGQAPQILVAGAPNPLGYADGAATAQPLIPAEWQTPLLVAAAVVLGVMLLK